MLPADVVRRRDLVLVDIRETVERRAPETGFLPASLALPPASWSSTEGTLAMLGTLDDVRGIVVHCLSGRRSEEARAILSKRTPLPIFDLEGGVLAWEAEGLPVCRVLREPVDPPKSLIDYRRHLLACFVGANAELALDRGMSPEPDRVLAECFRRARVPWEEPTIAGLYRVLDWSGVAMFRAGGRLRDIADNLVRMHAILRTIEGEDAVE
jgi:rhodanese-related sulfurtransferase